MEMVVDIEDHSCPCCRNDLHRIGEDVSERLDIVPAQLRGIVVRPPQICAFRGVTREAVRLDQMKSAPIPRVTVGRYVEIRHRYWRHEKYRLAVIEFDIVPQFSPIPIDLMWWTILIQPLLAATPRDDAAIGEVVARYELAIDFDTIPILAERHDLRLG
jgi:hypothetical protein